MNTCRQCGACCANYRVSFYWAEGHELGWPEEELRRVDAVRACLAGTDLLPSRCVALRGEVGAAVNCARYAQRPSPCREVQPGDEKCNRARAAHGLPAIPPRG